MEHDRKLEGACVTLSKVNCGMGKCVTLGEGADRTNIDRRVSDQKPKKFRLRKFLSFVFAPPCRHNTSDSVQ